MEYIPHPLLPQCNCYSPYYIDSCGMSQASQLDLLRLQQANTYITQKLINQLDYRFCQTQNQKKILTLDELYKIAFPVDPIQDVSKKEIEKIKAKYAWLNEYA